MKSFLAALLASASAEHLTPDNWDSLTAGKTVFIKFYAPWCGHCKAMKPAWDELTEAYDGHKTSLVAEVDCTAEGRSLCDANGVQGFPTIKHGDPAALEDYQGGRDLESMKSFAEENLKPLCSPNNLDLCDEEKKKEIQELQKLSQAELDEKISAKEAEIAAAEETFKTELEKLQKAYEELSKTKEDTIKNVKESGLGLMKAVRAHAAASKEEL